MRCPWSGDDPLYIRYHDEEWGVPVRDDRKLFEMLVLEGAQAGLSWITVLRKRENYRRRFHAFDPERVARMRSSTIDRLMRDDGLIRNRLKLESAVRNAKVFLEVRSEFGSFERFLREYRPARRRKPWRRISELPAQTDESAALSRELRQRGMNFVGPTICYAFMQAVGVVNDHLAGCFRFDEIERSR